MSDDPTVISPRSFDEHVEPKPVALTPRWERYGLRGYAMRDDHELICDYLDAHPADAAHFVGYRLTYTEALRRAQTWKEAEGRGRLHAL